MKNFMGWVLRPVQIMVIAMIVVSIAAIVHLGMTWYFCKSLYTGKSNLFEIGKAFKKYIDETGHLPSADDYLKNPIWSKEPGTLSYIYNNGDNIAGASENKDGLKWISLTAPSNTILLVQHAGPKRVMGAAGIAAITPKAVNYWNCKGYLVLFADGHIEQLKEVLKPGDTRLKFNKDQYILYKEATLCKAVKDSKPADATYTFLKGERIWIHIAWNKRNSNSISVDIFSPSGYAIAHADRVNKNSLNSWTNFRTNEDKWKTGNYTLVIYVNGKETEEKRFKLIK